MKVIKVTQTDIEKARRNDSYKCVVAQAIARQMPTAHHIEVDTQTIRFTIDDERHIYLTPPAASGYVIAFDAGDEMWPFSFQLRERFPIPTRRNRKVKTPEGKAADAAAARARVAVKRGASKSIATANRGASKSIATANRGASEPVDDLNAARAAAKAAYAAVREAQPGPTVKSDDGGPKPTTRVFKNRRRTYGMRALRINRDL
jgi:hypothetical protein